jgi:hypothetical protein
MELYTIELIKAFPLEQSLLPHFVKELKNVNLKVQVAPSIIYVAGKILNEIEAG